MLFRSTGSSITVNKATLTITADNKSKIYGDAVPALTATYFGFMNGETLATSGITGQLQLSTEVTKASGAGVYDILANGSALASGNYNLVINNGSFVVRKATIVVTAENKSRFYGTANPEFTASYAGFVNGESLATSGVYGVPAMSTLATETSDIGQYTISTTNGSLGAANYSFSLVNGSQIGRATRLNSSHT